jgi:hypothetical protein
VPPIRHSVGEFLNDFYQIPSTVITALRNQHGTNVKLGYSLHEHYVTWNPKIKTKFTVVIVTILDQESCQINTYVNLICI